MTTTKPIGTPLTPHATRVMLLGSGELGKEVLIALQRLGVETIAVDRYDNAPGQQVAHHARTIAMSDPAALRALVEAERPDLVVPEIEAIATPVLEALEAEGTVRCIPTARAARLTMDREGIRRLAAEDLGLPTSPYRFCDSLTELQAAIDGTDGTGGQPGIGYPCIVKPVMSSSGKGQSKIDGPADVQRAWDHAMAGGRVAHGRVIVEGFIDFDYEITQLTVRALGADGQVQTHFCDPIGHVQVSGDYVESWQPHPMSPAALERARQIAKAVTDNLGGQGLFGVELFVKGDQVWFSEVSPRPHDTGMVTMITQWQNEFELHARAILGLPVDTTLKSPGASAVVYWRRRGHGHRVRRRGRRGCRCRAPSCGSSASPRASSSAAWAWRWRTMPMSSRPGSGPSWPRRRCARARPDGTDGAAAVAAATGRRARPPSPRRPAGGARPPRESGPMVTDPLDGLTVLERGWLSSNNLLIHPAAGEPGAVLVDAGHVNHAAQTVALVSHALARQAGGAPLARLVNTHLHSDHCGGNATLQRHFGVPVAVPPGQAAAVMAWDDDALSYVATGQRMERFTPQQVLRTDEPLVAGGREWQVIEAPGHDPDAVLLWDARRQVLVSADALWENGFGLVFPELEGVSAFDDVEAVAGHHRPPAGEAGGAGPWPAVHRPGRRAGPGPLAPGRAPGRSGPPRPPCGQGAAEVPHDGRRSARPGRTARLGRGRTAAAQRLAALPAARPGQPPAWLREVVQELAAQGALAVDGDTVLDAG